MSVVRAHVKSAMCTTQCIFIVSLWFKSSVEPNSPIYAHIYDDIRFSKFFFCFILIGKEFTDTFQCNCKSNKMLKITFTTINHAYQQTIDSIWFDLILAKILHNTYTTMIKWNFRLNDFAAIFNSTSSKLISNSSISTFYMNDSHSKFLGHNFWLTGSSGSSWFHSKRSLSVWCWSTENV